MSAKLDKEILKNIYDFLRDELLGERVRANVPYDKGLKDLYNKFALFEDAEFNDLFITEDGKKASFLKRCETDFGTDIFVLYIEGVGLRRFYDDGVSLMEGSETKTITIAGRYEKK